MNIFHVLSQGRGRLNEENLSAMLAFLLSPTQSHGLGDIFLRRFLLMIAGACGDETRFDDVLKASGLINAAVILENPYEFEGGRRIIDVEVQIFARGSTRGADDPEAREIHRIGIENKVKASAAQKHQFREEFLAIQQDVEGEDAPNITMVFITPPGDQQKTAGEYDALDAETLGPHKKAWLRWAGAEEGNGQITALVKQILGDESRAEISPITDYMRHTLKAFVRHLAESSAGSQGRTSQAGDPGDVIDEVVVKLSDGTYKIERYENTTIRVMNMETGDYETAKPILRQINDEKNLGIGLFLTTGRKKNTRSLGREVIGKMYQRQD